MAITPRWAPTTPSETRSCGLAPQTAPRQRALHRAEHIGSAFKGGVNVRQRQLVNEVLWPLVTEFVPNFGREGATLIQRGPNASLLHSVQAIKLIRPIMRGSDISEAPLSPLVACCAHQVQSGAWQLLLARTKRGFFLLTSNREPQCRRPRPLRLCEPDHTVPACPGLHFHLLVTDLDSEGGSSWEPAICPPRRRRTPARQRAKAQSVERTSFTFLCARGA